MVKSELVQRLAARNAHLYERDIENIVDAILGEIASGLSRGDRVELRGFGAFWTKQRQARTGRNPKTGEQVWVDGKFCRPSRPAKKCASGSTSSPAKPRHRGPFTPPDCRARSVKEREFSYPYNGGSASTIRAGSRTSSSSAHYFRKPQFQEVPPRARIRFPDPPWESMRLSPRRRSIQFRACSFRESE